MKHLLLLSVFFSGIRRADGEADLADYASLRPILEIRDLREIAAENQGVQFYRLLVDRSFDSPIFELTIGTEAIDLSVKKFRGRLAVRKLSTHS